MKKLISYFAVMTVVLLLTSCYRVKPDGGEESVLISKPVFFGNGGVDPIPVSAGSAWVAASTDHVEFKITPLNIEEGIQEVFTKDNTPIDLTISLQVQIIKGQTPALYTKFNLQKVLLERMQTYIKSKNIPVELQQISISAISPPQEVLDETKKTAAQNQEKLTQISRADAELSRRQAEINKAIADKAYRLEMGMSQPEYLELRHLEIEKEKVELIKDKQNVSIIFGSGVQPTYSTNR